MSVYATRKETFNAVYRLYRDEWSTEKNREVFGKRADPNWYGHNYTLLVTVRGKVNEATGFLMDLKRLKVIIRDHVIEKLDHKNLNLEVDFMKGKIPTIELLCIEIFKQLKIPVEINPGVFLHSVRLYETEENFAEYFGN